MVQRVFTADLLSNQPPYNPRELGSSCVFADARETWQRTPASNHGTDATQQQGYNQVYYMENVVPSTRGVTSVGYQSVVDSIGIVPQYILECRTPDGQLSYVGVAQNQVLHWIDESGWKIYPNIAANPSFVPQAAVVRGRTYFYFGNFIVYTWDDVAREIVPVTLSGIDMGAILGICSGGSQLVLYTATVILYSAVLDATDFVPSLATGAGSTGILALKGTIVCCLPLGQDFVIYTQYSSVHARYTGNFALPFVYNEVPGSTGIVTQKHVAYNTNTGSHIVYGNAGIQELATSGVASIFPEISDQIAKGILSGIDPITDLIDYTIHTAINVKLSFVANRWLFISLGADPSQELFTEAYMYDTTLRRWGRLKVTHTAVFEWAGSASVEGIKSYQDLANVFPFYGDTVGKMYLELGSLAAKFSALNKQKISIMSHEGNVCVMVPAESGQQAGDNEGTDAAMPRAYIGRVKLFRDQGSIVQWIRLNKLIQGNIVLIGHDYNGAPVKQVENLAVSDFHAGTYSKRLNADTVTVQVRGTFVLTELQIAASSGGTHKQYAPTIKKFRRLLYSPLYPIEGDKEEMLAGLTFLEGRMLGQFTDAMQSVSPVVAGELRPVLQVFNQPYQDSDAYIISGVTVAGTLASVLKIVDQPYQTQDGFITSSVVVSGTLAVVLVSHTQQYQTQDGFIGSLSVSGTLS